MPPDPLDALSGAADIGQALQALRPLLRQVVEAADPAMLGAFDAAYDDGAMDAVEEMVNGRDDQDELSGAQALGLRNPIGNNVVAFIINVAASIAVAHVQTAHPDLWQWITVCPPAHTSHAQATHAEPVVRLFAHLSIPEEERDRAAQQFSNSATLTQALASAALP